MGVENESQICKKMQEQKKNIPVVNLKAKGEKELRKPENLDAMGKMQVVGTRSKIPQMLSMAWSV